MTQFDPQKDDFEYFALFLERAIGMNVPQDKYYLFETRLENVIKNNNFKDVFQLISRLRLLKEAHLIDQIIQAMTINETSFFRGESLFLRLKDIISDISKKQKHIKFWIAASSTGQEAYSLAIFMRENQMLFNNSTYSILSTDVSSRVISIAQRGIYHKSDVERGLSTAHLEKYFTKISPDNYEITHDLKSHIHFAKHNLLELLPDNEHFDIILCRNVLIYFNPKIKEKAVKNVATHLNKDGYLCIATTESIDTNLGDKSFIDCRDGIYKLAP
jgi:chemotaxis protein methyltransferase CheR